MKIDSFEAIAQALAQFQVRYLVAGGLAVNAHGYLRFTKDADLVVQLAPSNIENAFAALETLGYRPIVPVSATQFGDELERNRWMVEKGMQVLQFWSQQHRETPVDVFVTAPFDFDDEWKVAQVGELAPGVTTRFVSIPTLIKMKELANRPQDLADVQHLRWILEEMGKS